MATASMEFAAVAVPQPVVATSKTMNRRSAFLMCAPRLYDVDYVINPWMKGNVHAASREVAAAQWQVLYSAVSRLADVSLVEPREGSPDMVFTANAGLIYTRQDHNANHPNRIHDEVAISSFQHPERQGEETHFRQWFVENGYKILDVPRETPFEGEGDALFAEDGSRLWAGYGPRTSLASHQTLRDAWKINVVSLELIDPRFYHLDTCFAPLEGGYAMYYPGAFSQEGLGAIESFYPPEKRIVVQESDAVRFACNAVNIGRTIILNKVGIGLAATLETAGFELEQIELGEFLRAGGAAKCLVMRLR